MTRYSPARLMFRSFIIWRYPRYWSVTRGDRNVVDIDFLNSNQMKQKVEGTLEYLELNLIVKRALLRFQSCIDLGHDRKYRDDCLTKKGYASPFASQYFIFMA